MNIKIIMISEKTNQWFCLYKNLENASKSILIKNRIVVAWRLGSGMDRNKGLPMDQRDFFEW